MFYSTAVKDDPRNIKTGSPDNLFGVSKYII